MRERVNFRFGVLLLLALGLVALACSKKAISGPQFIFKPAPNDKVAAKFLGEEVTFEELSRGVESDIFDLEMKIHEIKMNKLRALVLKKLVGADPNSKNLSNDQYLKKYIAKDVKITQSAVDKFIKKRKIPKQHINENMKKRIKEYLEREEKKKAVDRWLGKKTAGTPIEVYFRKPSRPVFDVDISGAPITGGVSAKVTVVEFSDFQCPYCAKGSEILGQLKKKYGKKLKIAFKNFPLPFHNHAQLAAEAGFCVHEQDARKFWKMHDKMFADQSKLNKEGLLASAKEMGVDMNKFTACLNQGKYTAKVKEDMEHGKKVGVKSTPTFFVNGKMINGAQPIEVFAEIIDEELNK